MKCLKNDSVKMNLVMILIVFGAIFISIFISTIEETNFNNGFCIQCGTKYEAISRTNNGQTYYECPNCYYGTYK